MVEIEWLIATSVALLGVVAAIIGLGWKLFREPFSKLGDGIDGLVTELHQFRLLFERTTATHDATLDRLSGIVEDHENRLRELEVTQATRASRVL